METFGQKYTVETALDKRGAIMHRSYIFKDTQLEVKKGDIVGMKLRILNGNWYDFGGVGQSTHGQHNRLRAPGSVGACSYPAKVFKGTRMAGQMGNERVTVQNLQVIKVMPEHNLLLVKGSVPGAKGVSKLLPFAQRARLEQAGLNPDLMYGGSGSVTPSQMPGAAAGSAPNVDYGDTSGAFANGIRLAQQASLIDAQVSKIEMENRLIAEQALSQASLRELQSGQAADALARAEHQKIYNRHADTRYFLENEERGLKNTLLGADVNSYETRLRLDQQRVANDNMRAKVQVLQLGLNEKKLKADMEKIRAEVAEIMSRIKVNGAQQRKLVADAIETEALNHYYYKNGMVPTSNTIGWIANSITSGLINAFDEYKSE